MIAQLPPPEDDCQRVDPGKYIRRGKDSMTLEAVLFVPTP